MLFTRVLTLLCALRVPQAAMVAWYQARTRQWMTRILMALFAFLDRTVILSMVSTSTVKAHLIPSGLMWLLHTVSSFDH